MAIKGSLKEASLADVCQLLALGQKTGGLSVTDRSRFGQIYFDRGRITYAHVVNRRDRIGDLMVRDGVLTADQLARVLERQTREPDRRIGELLVEEGALSRDVLARYVRIQIEEAVYHLFTWSRGSFFFEPDEQPQATDILASINPENLLLEAARRIDEWSLIEKKIPSLDLIFQVDALRLRDADVELTAEQEQLAALLDGTRTVQELADEAAISEFDAGKAVYGLVQAGFAHCVGQREAADAPAAKEGEIIERRNLGTAFYRTRLHDDAAREFERVLELHAEDVVARFYLGLIALRQGHDRAAVRHFRALIEQAGPRFAAFVNMACALRRLGRLADALLVLDEAEAAQPRSAAVPLARALIHLERRDLGQATAAFDSYLRLAAGRPAVLYYHYAALTAALARDLERARRIVEQGLAEYPDSAPLMLMHGLIHERQGDTDAAEQWYGAAAEVDATSAHAQKNLGDIAYRRGHLGEALRHFIRATELQPAIGDDTYAKLGNLAYRSKDFPAAMRHWQRALELNPENEIVSNNLKIMAHATG
jgi:tetratricopeptide (TPR) repeat protein